MLYVIGEVATNELNKLARNGFSSFISKGLGEDIIVKFENNEAKLKEAIKNIKEIGLYVHIPFCKSKCYYCDFFLLSDRRDGCLFCSLE